MALYRYYSYLLPSTQLRLKGSKVADDVVLDDLVTLTDGYSGAEVMVAFICVYYYY